MGHARHTRVLYELAADRQGTREWGTFRPRKHGARAGRGGGRRERDGRSRALCVVRVMNGFNDIPQPASRTRWRERARD